MNNLDSGTPLPECDERPENRVFGEPDEELYGTMARNHRLNEEPIEASGRTGGSHALEHCHRFLPDPVGVAKIECNAADIALMGDVRRANLERDRKSDLRGERSDLVWIPGNETGDNWDPVRREHRAGLFGIEPGFPAASAVVSTRCAAATSGSNVSNRAGGVSIS